MVFCYFFFFFKQKTAYEMRISDWSSDVCSSDLILLNVRRWDFLAPGRTPASFVRSPDSSTALAIGVLSHRTSRSSGRRGMLAAASRGRGLAGSIHFGPSPPTFCGTIRSEEHTSELQSLMRISYAVFCLKKNKNKSLN